MSANQLPPCGIYRTTTNIGDVPAGRLVYFHNHGTPGPGIYLPEGWSLNRATFHGHGHTLPEPYARSAASLEALPAEGLYRVAEPFFCCEKKCRRFEPETLVQLGYDGEANAILFQPELSAKGLAIPDRGSSVLRTTLSKLVRLEVPERRDESIPADVVRH